MIEEKKQRDSSNWRRKSSLGFWFLVWIATMGQLVERKKKKKGIYFLLFFFSNFYSSAFKGFFFHFRNSESNPGALKILFGSLLNILVQWIPSSRLGTRIKESIVDASGSGKRSETKKQKTSLYYPQSRNESNPLQKAGNSVVFFFFFFKSHTGVALPTKPLYLSFSF